MPIKASTSNCIWEISLETSGPGASVGAQLLIRSHPADFAREKRGSWDLRAGCFDCIPLHVCSRCDFGLNSFPLLLKGSFFLFFISRTLFYAQFCRTNTAVRQFGGGDVFPPTRLPAVPKCLPGGVRERETGSAYAFVPRREHRNRGKSVSHRSGSHVGVGHVRQSVRTQLQRFLTLHQRGLGSFLTNGKNSLNCVLYLCWRCTDDCLLSMSPPLSDKNNQGNLVNLDKKNVSMQNCAIFFFVFTNIGRLILVHICLTFLQFGASFGRVRNVKSLTCVQKRTKKNKSDSMLHVPTKIFKQSCNSHQNIRSFAHIVGRIDFKKAYIYFTEE